MVFKSFISNKKYTTSTINKRVAVLILWIPSNLQYVFLSTYTLCFLLNLYID